MAGSMGFLGQSMPVQQRVGVESNGSMQRSAARAMSSPTDCCYEFLPGLRRLPLPCKAKLTRNSCRAAPTWP